MFDNQYKENIFITTEQKENPSEDGVSRIIACVNKYADSHFAAYCPNNFNAISYLALNPDLVRFEIDPYEHYCLYGKRTHRPITIQPHPPKDAQQKTSEKLAMYLRTEAIMAAYGKAWKNIANFPAMLTNFDKATYYYYASKMQFLGEAVDLGCFTGGTTASMAQGLADNPNTPRNFTIKAFDLFSFTEKDSYIHNFLSKNHSDIYSPSMQSFYPVFEKNIKPVSKRVNETKGDITTIGWPSDRPIELLGIDLCKLPHIADNVIRDFFIHLIPDHSVIIHQDYIHEYLPFIHISMEMLSDYFEPLAEYPNGNSYVWKCRKLITPEAIYSIFGEERATQMSCQWYTRYKYNDDLLATKQQSLIYAENRAMLGYVRAKYAFYMNLHDRAKELAKKTKAQFGWVQVPEGCRQLID